MKKELLIAIISLLIFSMETKAQLVVVNTEATSDMLMAPSLGLEIVTGNRRSIGINALYSKGL